MTFYTDTNFKTKTELKKALKDGRKIGVYAPGLGTPKQNGIETICGPWYPAPHSWYAQVEMKDGRIVKVKS